MFTTGVAFRRIGAGASMEANQPRMRTSSVAGSQNVPSSFDCVRILRKEQSHR